MTKTRYEWRRRRVTNVSRATVQIAIEPTKPEAHIVHTGPYLNRFDQRALAWSLAEIATPYLSSEWRLWLCAAIGAGELEGALIALLDRCAELDIALPDNVSEHVHNWLAGYAGTDLAKKFALYPASAQYHDSHRGHLFCPGAFGYLTRDPWMSRSNCPAPGPGSHACVAVFQDD